MTVLVVRETGAEYAWRSIVSPGSAWSAGMEAIEHARIWYSAIVRCQAPTNVPRERYHTFLNQLIAGQLPGISDENIKLALESYVSSKRHSR